MVFPKVNVGGIIIVDNVLWSGKVTQLDKYQNDKIAVYMNEFNRYIPLDGIILTKMDGTARGGIAISIMTENKLPVYFIGIGESENDLIPFDLDIYLKGLISEDNNN